MLRSFCTAALAAVTLLAGVSAAHAQAAPPLGLEESGELALRQQPMLQAQAAAIAAARESAIAAGQLPDPSLFTAVSDVPVEGPGRFDLGAEPETQIQAGVRQAFPGGDKRRLRTALGEREADTAEAELSLQRLELQREARLAWVEVWKAVNAQHITTRALQPAEQQLQATRIALSANLASQADVLMSQVELELLQDRLAELRQDEAHARNNLRRWLPQDSDRPVITLLPAWSPPAADELLAALDRHPAARVPHSRIEQARLGEALAREAYRPDWSLQMGYGYSPEYRDMAGLQVEVELPVFGRNRQDREIAARSHEREQAEQLFEDRLRELRSAVRLNLDDWNRLQDRFRRFDERILPQAQQRLDAALAAYRSNTGSLKAVLDARREQLEIEMQRLDLQLDAVRHQVELDYYRAALNEAPRPQEPQS